jgi:hypothetical protein
MTAPMVLTAPPVNKEAVVLQCQLDDLQYEVKGLIKMLEDEFGRQWLRWPIRHQLEKIRFLLDTVCEL